jgi:formylglycine-generating enzyme required for sulfatase activity
MKKRQFCVAGGMEAAVTTTLRTKAAGTLLLCAVLALAGCDNGSSPGSGGDSGGDTTYAPGALMTRTVSGKEIKFRYVPSGSFRRDSMAANVTVITQGYWLGETEVTQELFQAVMGTNWDREAKHPVNAVAWFEAIAFCNKLSVADGKNPVYSVSGISDWANLAYSSIPKSSGDVPWYVTQDLNKNGYRLPTEMDWMWAAMGADKSAQPNTSGYYKPFAGSNGSNSIEDCAWYSDMLHEVGKKTANELNLFDMSGNVYEWVWDWYDRSYLPSGELTDFAGPAFGTSRVLRGGSAGVNASGCTVASRRFEDPNLRYNDIGFRVLAAAQ